MKNYTTSLILFSGVAGMIASIGDFIVTFILGFLYPGYSFIHQTESYLGTADSPVALYMNMWGIIFCILLLIYSWGLKKTIFRKGKWQALTVWLVAVYGACEGAGSGIFPYDHIGQGLSNSAILHDVFGAAGGLSVALIPIAGAKIFSKASHPTLHRYSRFSFVAGLVLITIFLLSKGDVLPYKGLWQRIFILNYHLYLVVVSFCMLNGIGWKPDFQRKLYPGS